MWYISRVEFGLDHVSWWPLPDEWCLRMCTAKILINCFLPNTFYFSKFVIFVLGHRVCLLCFFYWVRLIDLVVFSALLMQARYCSWGFLFLVHLEEGLIMRLETSMFSIAFPMFGLFFYLMIAWSSFFPKHIIMRSIYSHPLKAHIAASFLLGSHLQVPQPLACNGISVSISCSPKPPGRFFCYNLSILI